MVRVEEGRAYRYVRALFPRTASRSMNWSFSNDFGVWDASDGRVQVVDLATGSIRTVPVAAS